MFPFVDDRLYHIEGGNYRLAVELFKYAAAKLHQPAQIGTVERQSSGQWRLTFASNTCGTCSVKQVFYIKPCVFSLAWMQSQC